MYEKNDDKYIHMDDIISSIFLFDIIMIISNQKLVWTFE